MFLIFEFFKTCLTGIESKACPWNKKPHAQNKKGLVLKESQTLGKNKKISILDGSGQVFRVP
jgi:hypothetical protein